MTREHKLALIVGFAFVLVVGVLLSDHFSSARKTQPRGDVLSMGPREAGGSTMSLDQPAESRLGERVSIGDVRDRPFILPDPTPRATYPTGGVQDPLAGGVDPNTPYNPNAGGSASVLDEHFVRVPDGQRPSIIDMGGGAGSTPIPGFNGVAARTETVPIPLGPTPPSPLPGQPQATDPNRVALPPVAPAPRARTYTAREGDSLYAIARRELGDGNKWLTLRDLNRKLVGDEGELLQPGMKLTLPGQAPASAAGAPERATAAATTKPGTYTIQKGDALSLIAQKTLGSARRWPELVSANRGVIDDPDSLPVGAVIKIPAR